MTARKAILISAYTALLAGGAAGATAVATAAPLEIITLKVRVTSQNGATNGDFPLGTAVPAMAGQTLRLALFGTGILNGAGREVPVNARFTVAAGGRNLSLLQSGPNWALVSVSGGGNPLGQLAYATTGDYRIKPGLASGRITLQARTSPTSPAPPSPGNGNLPPGVRPEGWRQALALNVMLYRAILGTTPGGDDARANASRIYQQGYGGVLTVAVALARTAENAGQGRSTLPRGYEERDIERLGALYRDLLHRQQSNQTLWQQDAGFRANVKALHAKGLPVVVSGLVDSAEFRSTNQIGPR
jgi:hypothetical protein